MAGESVQVFVRQDAEFDALGYLDYLHARSPETAARFLVAVDRTIDGLRLQPLKGRPRNFRGPDLKHVRSWRMDGFENYLMFYRYTENRLEIMRIKHGAMKFPRALRG